MPGIEYLTVATDFSPDIQSGGEVERRNYLVRRREETPVHRGLMKASISPTKSLAELREALPGQ